MQAIKDPMTISDPHPNRSKKNSLSGYYDIHHMQFRAMLKNSLKNNKDFMQKLTRKTNSGFSCDEATQLVLEENNYQLLIDIWKKYLDVLIPC